jgi:hypothetical protein
MHTCCQYVGIDSYVRVGDGFGGANLFWLCENGCKDGWEGLGQIVRTEACGETIE